MARPRYIVGIDLGTTNCAVAYVDTKGRERPAPDIRVFNVPQLVAAGETAARAMLPSFLYLPGAHELPPEAARLPWRDDADRIVGEFARAQGARVPSHLVASAKSWLCHAGVDREAEILPWQAPSGARRVSPVDATADYLRHIRDSWNHAMAHDAAADRLESQEIVLTVPASFDEAARELTVAAAKRAGFAKLTLLEEPQAAFYCWIVTHQDAWQSQVRAGELILVCDIGGGTTDFSLITVVETPTGPGFRRVAVGDHLLLGGDNMDLALAHTVEERLGGARLDAEQWSALRFACRAAKEKLLDDDAAHERWPVTIAGRGSKLIGGSLQAELTRGDVAKTVVDGFFPISRRDDTPSASAKTGLQEFGLPYVADPAITRHLAAFLRTHRGEQSGEGTDSGPALARPSALLFNGGALAPAIVRERITDVIASWFPGEAAGWRPRVLVNASLDLAVAMGAAYFGVVRRGGGIRIGGGTARSLYVGIDAGSDSPDSKPWLCVVPRDAQDGDEFEIGRDFELLMGQHVSFPLASSSVRPGDRPGDLVADDSESIRPLPPLVGFMKVGRKARAERVPVHIAGRLTEVGTVELWCHSQTDDRRWQLQIQLRGPEGRARASTAAGVTGGESDAVVLEQAAVDRAVALVREAFGPHPPAERAPARLVKNIEVALETPRDQWPPSAIRELWKPLREVAESRARSPQHESRWLNLSGYCLRPGTGFPLDEARMKALWSLWSAGVQNPKDTQCWVEWWVVWRRVSAGLNRSQQEEIHRRLLPFLMPAKGATPAKKAGRPKPDQHEQNEMWRCVGSLERLSVALKEPLGAQLAHSVAAGAAGVHVLWALGRIGARIPLFGPANAVLLPEVVSPWIEHLIAYQPQSARESTETALALVQLARVSNDRARDVELALRDRVVDRLDALGCDDEAIDAVRAYRELARAQQSAALGDALPVGLRLVGEG